MGPLMISRPLFVGLGGFNETLSVRGRPSSLLDCDVSARAWQAGASVFVTSPLITRRAPSAAWQSAQMLVADYERCNAMRALYARTSLSLPALRRVNARVAPRCAVPHVTSRADALVSLGEARGRWGRLARGVWGPPRQQKTSNDAGTSDRAMEVDVSFLLLYWGGSRGWRHKLEKLEMTMPRVKRAAYFAGVRSELIIADDSIETRSGDVDTLLGLLDPDDAVLLSANMHELRAYNRLAAISRGRLFVFLQDDDVPPRPQQSSAWLMHSLQLFNKFPQTGSVSIKTGLFWVGDWEEEEVGTQTLADLAGGMPRCSVSLRPHVPNVSVEAMRCADVGPLFVARWAFEAVGGFNESGTRRGEAGSVRVDCELQARMWLLQPPAASLAVGLKPWQKWETPAGEHEIWRRPGMQESHRKRTVDYKQRFELDQSPARLAIEAAARQMNSHFSCPLKHLATHRASKLDCFVLPC
mmetsp:Transcript_34112/g.74886  ORF Transcript_34112/g.74886 Transcript_34112/m.74886 type:complete len:469 (-) Transcript_34112:310-1716(-)